MKGLIIFGLGAVCGSLGTLFWLQKDYKKRLEQAENELYSRAEEAKNDAKSGEKEGSEGEKSEKNKADSGEKGESELRRVQENQRVLEGLSGQYGYRSEGGNASLTREKHVNYSEISSRNSDENEENSVSLLKTKSDTCQENAKIYEISYEEFEYEAPENTKKCLKYFAKNDTFVDFEGTISDTCHFCNEKWHEDLRNCMPEKMWIRDETNGCDYEIFVVDDAYIDDDFYDEKEV